jgi:hypothetical protein
MGIKGKTLMLESNYSGILKGVDINAGKMVVENKYEFLVDNVIPIMLKEGFGSKPLFITKWSSLTPIRFKKVEKIIPAEKVKQMIEEDKEWMRLDYEVPEENPEIKSSGKLRRWLSRKKIKSEGAIRIPTAYIYKKLEVVEPDIKETKGMLPELMKETFDMRFLKNMKKYSEGKGGGEGISKGKAIMLAVVSMVVGIGMFYMIMTMI